MDTRPGEISRREAQRIAEETAALLKIADSEREFREYVLVTLAELKAGQSSMSEAFAAHVETDDERFGSVTQNIGDSRSKIAWMLGATAGAFAIAGAAFALARMLP